jgi:hypothetical protein
MTKTKDLSKEAHIHVWRPLHTQVFSGVVCDCGVRIPLKVLADLFNEQVTRPKPGPSETK